MKKSSPTCTVTKPDPMDTITSLFEPISRPTTPIEDDKFNLFNQKLTNISEGGIPIYLNDKKPAITTMPVKTETDTLPDLKTESLDLSEDLYLSEESNSSTHTADSHISYESNQSNDCIITKWDHIDFTFRVNNEDLKMN